MTCKMCGSCCNPIIMNYDYDFIRDVALRGPKPDNQDGLFLLNNCIKITGKEANYLNPKGTPVDYPQASFFLCWYFNDKTKLCENINKPRFCKNFPDTLNYVNKDCGYYVKRKLKND